MGLLAAGRRGSKEVGDAIHLRGGTERREGGSPETAAPLGSVADKRASSAPRSSVNIPRASLKRQSTQGQGLLDANDLMVRVPLTLSASALNSLSALAMGCRFTAPRKRIILACLAKAPHPHIPHCDLRLTRVVR